jgi:hypothetical protein
MKLQYSTKGSNDLLDFKDLMKGHIYEVVSDDYDCNGDVVIRVDRWSAETPLVTILGENAGDSWSEDTEFEGHKFREVPLGSYFVIGDV